MERKNSQTFNIYSKYVKDIQEFCSLNNIENLELFVNQCFKQGFDIQKYGLLGKTDGIGEKRVEIEVIREKRVEVPVEVIKYVDREVIKEVPVEKIVEVVKEIPVEKIVNIYDIDDEKIFQLNKDFDEERQKFSIKTQEMEYIFQNEMSKKDEELDKLRRTLDKFKHSNEKKSKNDKTQMLQNTLTNLRTESLKKDEKIKELEERINKINNQLGNTKAIYHQDSNLKKNL